jgi:hypothetical protein
VLSNSLSPGLWAMCALSISSPARLRYLYSASRELCPINLLNERKSQPFRCSPQRTTRM